MNSFAKEFLGALLLPFVELGRAFWRDVTRKVDGSCWSCGKPTCEQTPYYCYDCWLWHR